MTSIAIDYVDPDHWVVGRRLLTAQGRTSIYFDIKFTDETNTKQEKEQYMREAFDGFARLLGNLHEESYIYVQDVRAAAYGFSGKTQEYRYHHPFAHPPKGRRSRSCDGLVCNKLGDRLNDS